VFGCQGTQDVKKNLAARSASTVPPVSAAALAFILAALRSKLLAA